MKSINGWGRASFLGLLYRAPTRADAMRIYINTQDYIRRELGQMSKTCNIGGGLNMRLDEEHDNDGKEILSGVNKVV